jgi:hypothetical protein
MYNIYAKLNSNTVVKEGELFKTINVGYSKSFQFNFFFLVFRLVKKSLTFYRTLLLITAFLAANHCTLNIYTG